MIAHCTRLGVIVHVRYPNYVTAVLLLHGFAPPAAEGVSTEVIHFTHGEVVVEGVIAWDDQAAGPRPGA